MAIAAVDRIMPPASSRGHRRDLPNGLNSEAH